MGNSDHSTVLLLPTYRQKSKQSKPVQETVQCWTHSAGDTLKNCLDIANWSVFENDNNDMNNFTDVVCSYIYFCIDQCLPTKVVKVFQNNKVWFNATVKENLKKER